ncbi:hypothetical protein [Rhodobacter sp. SY28-1]|uniref:hypothetical protein n=1 Tax=Rhodobacter sp. SY28-1 TaxID=2562317 RepID=UPI0010BF6D1E|nr:hypothetical protein [Rhodobacter sp. SY28-1]
MWFEAIGKVKQSQPGKFILGCTGASAIILAVGLTAVPVQAGLLDGLGVDVDVGKGGVDVDVDLGPADVDVDVGLDRGGLDVGVDVGLGGDGPGGPGVNPGDPTGPGGVIVDDDGLRRAARNAVATGAMACAKDGNETAYNGFLVRDRNGAAFGWIHEATVSPNGKLVSVRLQTSGNSCYKLSNASFRIKGDEVWTNADAMKFR